MAARSGDVSKYIEYIEHLTTIDSFFLNKTLVFVTITLKFLVLLSLHAGHLGMSSMIVRAETSVIWPGMREDTQTFRAQGKYYSAIAG